MPPPLPGRRHPKVLCHQPLRALGASPDVRPASSFGAASSRGAASIDGPSTGAASTSASAASGCARTTDTSGSDASGIAAPTVPAPPSISAAASAADDDFHAALIAYCGNEPLRAALLAGAAEAGVPMRDGGCYGHVDGPRFNTKAEIRGLAAAGVTAVSQTAGPETVLAGESEIPFALVGYATDYANGVQPEATPVERLLELIAASTDAFATLLGTALPLIDVAALARGVNMSAGHLSRAFRQAYGEPPYSYLMTRRIERAMALLRRGDLSVTEICFEVGCSSLGTFSTRFTELVGVPPSVYRQQAADATAGMPSCVAKQIPRPIRNREAPGQEPNLE